MTEFRKGDRAIVTGDSKCYRHGFPAGTKVVVHDVDGSPSTSVERANGDRRWVGNEDLALAEPETPAPIDPSKVKAGDTVTLTKDETSVRGPVTGISYAGGGEWDFRVGEEPYRRTGRIGLWAVTAHQPAPEPEPEWKPGTFGWADVPAPHGRAHGFLTDRNFVYLVDEPEQDESTGYNVTADFSNFNPDVFLAPAKVGVPNLAALYEEKFTETNSSRAALRAVLSELGLPS